MRLTLKPSIFCSTILFATMLLPVFATAQEAPGQTSSDTDAQSVDSLQVTGQASAGTSCSTNATPRTVVICRPINNTDVSSPVHITAAVHHGASGIKVVQVYVDGVKKYETGLSGLGQADNGDVILNVDIPASAGLRRITVQAVDSSGSFKSTVYVTVAGGTGCSTSGAARTVHICQPANNSTASSPTHITAALHPGSTTLKLAQIYVDGNKKFETTLSGLGNADNGDEILNTDLGFTRGTHRLTVQGVDSQGSFKSTIYFTVK